uniref:Biotinidase n=1 Tax=Gasterosteus aculeatus aculeatus TaxID=481459 RepID=A0AAQ4S6X0_GASAC|nr:biotinidase [Gasterosteus aculeatus aculeatus]
MFRLVVVVVGLCFTSAADRTEPAGGSWFVAAVYEHSVVLNPEPRTPLSRPAALRHMHDNLRVFEQQAALAAQQGAQILVFPEDGLQGFNFSRSSISGYLETIPDPQQESWNPCTEPGKYNNTEVLQSLSCMARRYNLYLVANMADLQLCPKTEPSSCPSDGRWQFNTNVVFRSDGLLVARYHKHNLYFEEAFDKPPRPEITTFDTPFAGTFGLITCFDILFQEPTLTLLEKGVRQIIFPTAWMNQLPLLDTIQFQKAFSSGANVTLLAANIRSDRLIMTGSGIYTPTSATCHHAQRGDPEEGRLLVARVPVLDPLWMEHRVLTEEEKAVAWGQSTSSAASGYCHEENCFDAPPPETASSVLPSSTTTTFISSMMYDPFTFVLLNETEGKVRVCNGTFCCRLQYRRLAPGGSKELYALGAFAGTHTVNGRYALQVCALVRCAGLEVTSCGQEVEEAESKLDFLLEGRFGTRYVYPSVLVNRLVLEQPQHLETAADGRVTMKHSKMTAGLVTACLYGRMYHLDQE